MSRRSSGRNSISKEQFPTRVAGAKETELTIDKDLAKNIKKALSPGKSLLLTDNEKTEAVIDYINDLIESEKIGFPFIATIYSEDPRKLFTNVQKFVPRIEHEKFKVVNVKAGRKFFERHPTTFRRKSTYIPSDVTDYEKINIITDFYTEEARVKSVGFGATKSPYDQWYSREDRKVFVRYAVQEGEISLKKLRQGIFVHGHEARGGKITNSLGLYHFLSATRVLDPSAAWGDRLIAALGSPTVNTYYGIDPNPDLKSGWKGIITDLGPLSKKDPKNFVTMNLPFEDADLKGTIFDFVIISPPPYMGEKYANPEGQSTKKYPKYPDWFAKFMVPYVCQAATNLADGGYIALTVLDRLAPRKPRENPPAGTENEPNEDYVITEPLLLAIEAKCEYLIYEGVIGWQTETKKMVPWWMFRKRILTPEVKSRRVTSSSIVLSKFYSDLFCKEPPIVDAEGKIVTPCKDRIGWSPVKKHLPGVSFPHHYDELISQLDRLQMDFERPKEEKEVDLARIKQEHPEIPSEITRFDEMITWLYDQKLVDWRTQI